MKYIYLDVIKGNIWSEYNEPAEGDVGSVKVTISNLPEEWNGCSVWGLFTQSSYQEKVPFIGTVKDDEGNIVQIVDTDTITVPATFTQQNKAFKFAVYAVNGDTTNPYLDIRPSVWIRVRESDYVNTEVDTSEPLDLSFYLQQQLTAASDAEGARAEAEAKRQLGYTEQNRKISELSTTINGLPLVKRDISGKGELNGSVNGVWDKSAIYYGAYGDNGTYFLISLAFAEPKEVHQHLYINEVYEYRYGTFNEYSEYTWVDDWAGDTSDSFQSGWRKPVMEVPGYRLSSNDFSDSCIVKLDGIEEGAQVNEPADQTYNGGSSNAQSGYAVAEAIAKAFSDFVGSSPAALDTVYELAAALKNNPDIINQLLDMLGLKIEKVKVDGEALAVDSSDKSVNIDLSGKVDKVDGKGLSTNDFTDEEKEKLEGIDPVTIVSCMDLGWTDWQNDSKNLQEKGVYKLVDAPDTGAGEYVFLIVQNYNESWSTIVQIAITSGGIIQRYAEDSSGEFHWHDWVSYLTFNSISQTYSSENRNAQSGVAVAQAIEALKSEINPTPTTTIPSTLSANKSYNFGEVAELCLVFPATANDGDVIYITFKSGETPTTIVTDFTNVSDGLMDLIPEANTGYEIFAKYNGSIWIANYSEYTFTGVTTDLGGDELGTGGVIEESSGEVTEE